MACNWLLIGPSTECDIGTAVRVAERIDGVGECLAEIGRSPVHLSRNRRAVVGLTASSVSSVKPDRT